MCEQVIEFMLYLLWDLGLKVGHATRSVDECLRQAKADLTIRTGAARGALRLGRPGALSGAAPPLPPRTWSPAAAAPSSRPSSPSATSATSRMGDSRYALEPNIKEGKGGLRDLHTLFWIAQISLPGATTSRSWSSAAC